MNKKLWIGLSLLLVIIAIAYTLCFGEEYQRTSITSAGEYTYSGKIQRQIEINAPEDAEVTLILNGAEITNTNSSAIQVKSAKKLTIELKEGSENIVSNGTENSSSGEGSAIVSEAEIVITGEGSLTVYGYNNNGIHGKGDVSLESGDVTIIAAGDALQADGNLNILGGNLKISTFGMELSDIESLTANNSEGFGMGGGFMERPSGDNQQEPPEKPSEDNQQGQQNGNMQPPQNQGFNGGGWQGMGGRQKGPMGGGPGNREMPNDQNGQRPQRMENFNSENKQEDFTQRPQMMENFDSENTKEDFSKMPQMGQFDFEKDQDEDETSSKGLKAAGLLNIEGGTLCIYTKDDAIHSSEITISNGTLSLATGDDGIHADTSLVIKNAEIEILCSYESIESPQITIESGSISLVASDDGLNANGGSDGFSMGGFRRNKQESTEIDTTLPSITINGGELHIDARGDGIDSNGNIIINDGKIIVDGPSSGANGALDSGSESGGILQVNGGELLAIGSSQMAEEPSSSSSQIYKHFKEDFTEGSVIKLTDASGNEIFSHTAKRSGNSIIYSSPKLEKNIEYKITVEKTQ